MAYQRNEYHREVERDEDKQGGWKSWFGLGDKKDEVRFLEFLSVAQPCDIPTAD
jgi:hypothetical protein